MRKAILPLFLLLLTLTGCSRIEQRPLAVYSFSGENDLFAVSNGVIVLNGPEEIFSGGYLETFDGFPTDVTAFSATYYARNGAEKDTFLSNAVVDQTGHMLRVSGDLGKISGDDILTRFAGKELLDFKDNLYLDLTLTDSAGKQHTYTLHMTVREITGNANMRFGSETEGAS